MQKMMKQAQQIQKKIAAIQEQMATKTCEAQAGGGVVKAVVNGKQELLQLQISPEALEGGDAEMLQDLIKVAVNEALRKSQEMSSEAMNSAVGGNLPFPPGMLF